MSETMRSGRDEALLSKLDRTMDSILAANAGTPFKPKLRPGYAAARFVAWLTILLGWALILIGLAALAIRAGVSAFPDFAHYVDWIEPLQAGAGVLGGVVLINFAAMTRANLDAADYARQLLQLAAARASRPMPKSRPAGRNGAEKEHVRERLSPLAEAIEPRL